MKRVVIMLLVGVMVFAVAATAQRPNPNPSQALKRAGTGAVGQIVYDTGAPQDLALGPTPGVIEVAGNRFNSANGNPLIPGTVYTASFYVRIAGSPTALISVFGSVNGTTAPILAPSIVAPGVTSLTFNAFSFAPVNVGSSFLGGLYLPAFYGGTRYLGMVTDTTGGQGFHAFQGNWTNSAFLVSVADIPGQNAMLRMTGDVIPVELMNFEIE